MKKVLLYILLALPVATTQLTACKNKNAPAAKETTTPTTADTTTRTAPVEIAADDQLQTGVRDAVKDYPTVTASVNNGEVSLSGTVKRDRLRNLIQSIQSLHPKKVNQDQLTVQP